eukprot:6352717-Amphidinium_carterae.1
MHHLATLALNITQTGAEMTHRDILDCNSDANIITGTKELLLDLAANEVEVRIKLFLVQEDLVSIHRA